MKNIVLIVMITMCLSACRTLDYAKGRGETIRDRESYDFGHSAGSWD